MRSLLLFCSILFVSACSPNPTSPTYQTTDNFSRDLDAAIDRAIAEGDQNCPKSTKVGYLISSKCRDKFYEKNYEPIFLNNSALTRFRHAAIALAAQADRTKMSKDEVQARGDILWDDLINAENVSRAQISAHQQISAQRENAAYGAALQSLGTSLKKKYSPPPPINCNTVYNPGGSTTQCRQQPTM